MDLNPDKLPLVILERASIYNSSCFSSE